MKTSSRRDGGFTLVEVMVALAVVAVALPALLVAVYQQVDGAAYLRDKSLAQLVAVNKLTELRLLDAANNKALSGPSSGIYDLADRQWYWWMNSRSTELPNFFRLEIKVADSEENQQQPLYILTAFLNADLQPGRDDD